MNSPDAQGSSPVSGPVLPDIPARSALMPAVFSCWLASAVCIIVMAFRGGSVAWVVAWFTMTAASVAVTRMADRRTQDGPSGRVTGESSLDGSCRQLLGRVQLAIAAILGSEVYAAGLLDHAAGQIALRRHEDEITSTLREITALRAEFHANLRNAPHGSMTGTVLESHRQALAAAQAAIASRVHAIERYAAQVQRADAAWRHWHSSPAIAGQGPPEGS